MNPTELCDALNDETNFTFQDIPAVCRLSNRPDLCALMLLDSLVPGTRDIVAAAEHDEIFLRVTIEQLAPVITREQVRALLCCGVRLDSETDSLAMFV